MKILEEILNKDVTRAFKAPEKTTVPKGFKSIFLAGSIEMDKAEKWQAKLTTILLKEFNNIIVFNPRRDEWDSSWKQEIKNKQFYEQVDWEHEHIVESNCVFIYFQPDTQSPISLLELGLVADMNIETIVCCPDGFWRKGNVDYICKKYDLTMIDDMEELPTALKKLGWK